ncbi:NAD(P)/FAD-dependent oxidoreductase [Streptomyces sp. NPDC055299]
MPKGAGRAVVIGGGFAGLLAARALADRMSTVTIIERDPWPAANGHRRGAPQTRHPHGLLHRGTTALETLFPGLRAELLDVGAASFDFGQGTRILFPAGWAPVGHTGVQHLACSRTALEDLLRRHVHNHPRVDVAEAVADGLLWRNGRVAGVRDAQGRSHCAELVVDASGRASRLTSWLTRAGIPTPPSRHVHAGLSYVTRSFESAPDIEWHMSAEMTYAPTIRRGGLVQRIERDRILVTLIGADGVRPPHDTKEFAVYASDLRTPHLADIIATATPTGETCQYGGLSNRWHLYHRVRSWPDGLIAVGDSVAALNPIYGHGLTVAALEAVALRDLLDAYPAPGFTRKFQRASATIIRLPWLFATLSDAGWRPDRQSLPVGLANRTLRHVLDRIPEEPDLYRRLVRVQNLLAHPVTLGRAWTTAKTSDVVEVSN